MNIEGRTIRLRAVEPEDADLMYVWENDGELDAQFHTLLAAATGNQQI